MPERSDPGMRAPTRLQLLCHAPTAATRRAAFPADEPLDGKALAACAALTGRLPATNRVLCSPALAARQTAQALGLDAEAQEILRDLDPGRWAGRSFDDVSANEAEGVMAWLSDPAAAPHSGESIASLIDRIGTWLESGVVEGRVLAVTHAAVARAALIHVLSAPARAFWRIDVPPLALIDLRRSGGTWTLRAMRLRGEKN